MRILHVALLSPGQPNTAIGRALKYYAKDYMEIDWVKIRDTQGINEVGNVILGVARSFQPHLIFMQLQTPGILDYNTAKELREFCFVVNWTGDVRENIGWYIDLGSQVDLTLFTNMTDVKKMRDLGKRADYLQIGFDNEIYNSKAKPKFPCPDIIFTGNNYITSSMKFPGSKERVDMVNYMLTHFRHQFMVYGNGWGSIRTRHLNPQDEAAAMSSAKMAINQNHFEYERFSSDRILRIMASGALCLTKYYPGIELEYEDKVHLRVWNTFEELHSLCRYYLDPAHEAERLSIAKAGQQLVLSQYTWHNRVYELIALARQYDTSYKVPTLQSGKLHWLNQLATLQPWKKHSQFGEESYLAFILAGLGLRYNGHLVDLGAGDGTSISNTYYFLDECGYLALMIDADPKGSRLVYEHKLTRENVLQLMHNYGTPPKFELLSIDIDGNDYWILEEVLKDFEPQVIIAEINPRFKREESFAMKYNPDYSWNDTDYYGMSLAALEKLGARHGYAVVHLSDSLNAYLIKRTDILQPVIETLAELQYEQKFDHAPFEGEWEEIK